MPDERTRREKLEDMARLGTPREQEAARRALARMPPDDPPPVHFHVQYPQDPFAGTSAARRWSMPPPSGEEWTPERAERDAAVWKAAFEAIEKAMSEQQEKLRAYADAVSKFAAEVERAQARRQPPPRRR